MRKIGMALMAVAGIVGSVAVAQARDTRPSFLVLKLAGASSVLPMDQAGGESGTGGGAAGGTGGAAAGAGISTGVLVGGGVLVVGGIIGVASSGGDSDSSPN